MLDAQPPLLCGVGLPDAPVQAKDKSLFSLKGAQQSLVCLGAEVDKG